MTLEMMTLWTRPTRSSYWTAERACAKDYIKSLGFPCDGTELTLDGRVWKALAPEIDPNLPELDCITCGAALNDEAIRLGDGNCQRCFAG